MNIARPIVIVAALLAIFAAPHALAEKPNILLIMTDDQGWGDIRSHGNEQIDTPVLDALAADGARFDRFYVSPVCAPTRASLLTGRYHSRTGVHGVTRGHENMRADEVTIAEVLKAAGYATGCFGKWHNGAHFPMHPNGQGFDEFYGFCGGHWNLYFDSPLEHNGRAITGTGYITDYLTDEALRFIERNRERPWFAYLPYNPPHSPWQVPDRYFEKYKARGLSDEAACAYGMVENIDDNVGRLLKKLDELKMADNTIVLFLTDNGPNTDRYNGDMRGRKGSVHEGGVRVPLFVRWRGTIAAGTVMKPIAAHIDLLPTLVGLAGIDAIETKPLDGVSFAPMLLGAGGEPAPDRIIFSRWANRGSARTQRWRAVRERANQGWQLYDMLADPGQKKDVADQFPEVVQRLATTYDANWSGVSTDGFDPIPIPIGHAQRDVVTLPGHEAYLQPAKGKGISYHGPSGWANDWVDNWTDTDAYPQWEVDVVRGGRYAVSLLHVCPKDAIGSRVSVRIGNAAVEGAFTREHDPEPIVLRDLVGRKEAPPMEWAELSLGEVELSPGHGQLVIRALAKPGAKMPPIKAVRLRRVER